MHALLVSVLTVTAGPRAESEKPLEEPHILGRRIKEYIDKHYMEPITLQSIGVRRCTSVRITYRMFSSR